MSPCGPNFYRHPVATCLLYTSEFTREVFEAQGYVEKAIDEMPFIDDALLHKRLVEDALRDPELTRRIFANLATVRHRMEF